MHRPRGHPAGRLHERDPRSPAQDSKDQHATGTGHRTTVRLTPDRALGAAELSGASDVLRRRAAGLGLTGVQVTPDANGITVSADGDGADPLSRLADPAQLVLRPVAAYAPSGVTVPPRTARARRPGTAPPLAPPTPQRPRRPAPPFPRPAPRRPRHQPRATSAGLSPEMRSCPNCNSSSSPSTARTPPSATTTRARRAVPRSPVAGRRRSTSGTSSPWVRPPSTGATSPRLRLYSTTSGAPAGRSR